MNEKSYALCTLGSIFLIPGAVACLVVACFSVSASFYWWLPDVLFALSVALVECVSWANAVDGWQFSKASNTSNFTPDERGEFLWSAHSTTSLFYATGIILFTLYLFWEQYIITQQLFVGLFVFTLLIGVFTLLFFISRLRRALKALG